jgi:molecular chaperone GrpE
LSKEGVVRIETTGQPFDPAVMMAVAAEADPAHPPQTVLEELAAGYCRHDELLRPAQVKVSR